MRVLVTGAYGFIGSHIVARLLTDGFAPVGAGRDVAAARRRWPQVEWIAADFARMQRPEDWLPHLQGVDAVVNCAGVLQDNLRDSTRAVHVQGPAALFAACERAGVRRVIQISAIGVGTEAGTEFARTKLVADEDLMRRDLDWVVLRPSLVLARGVYGSTALIRALALFPGIVPLAQSEALVQPVQMDDLSATVAFLFKPGAPARRVLEVVGPERMTLGDLVHRYRRWLGFRPAPMIRVPDWLAAAAFRLGDAVSLLGWRPPLRTTAQRQLARDVVGDPAEWTRLTGIAPRGLEAALAREPAGVQDRWFARLYLLKPLIVGGLALFWIASGLIALGPARGETLAVTRAAVGEWAFSTAVAASLLDIAVGTAIAFRRTARAGLHAAWIVSLGYLAGATLYLPRLWLDPLGALVKVLPILLLTWLALAILDDR
jgi:uncharacterized protein YbjT (DUF2867 family)